MASDAVRNLEFFCTEIDPHVNMVTDDTFLDHIGYAQPSPVVLKEGDTVVYTRTLAGQATVQSVIRNGECVYEKP